jgi:hypothetical protein
MMGKGRTSMALGFAAAVLALWPATAAAAQDQHSDRAALTAYHSYLAGVTAHLGDAHKADAAFASSISQRCPNALASLKQAPAGSVNRTALFDFGEEIGGDAGVVAYGPARVEFRKMAGTLRTLPWSSPQSSTVVRRYLTAQSRLFGIAPSDLCADAHALVASHGETIPSGTSHWLAKFRGAASAQQSAAASFAALLKNFETPADKGLAASDNRLFKRLSGSVGSLAKSSAGKIINVLGL